MGLRKGAKKTIACCKLQFRKGEHHSYIYSKDCFDCVLTLDAELLEQVGNLMAWMQSTACLSHAQVLTNCVEANNQI